MLGRQIVREIIYRVLREEKDGALRAFANRNGNFMRIARVLKEVHADSARPFTVEIKRIRLDRAKRLMMHDGCNASTAAKAVGYESASQFSREFKRQFGVTPMEDVKRLRQAVEAQTARRG